MSIAARIVIGEFPYGNPASLGEPLGLFNGQALLTGDATGGQVSVSFVCQNPTDTPTLSDHRRRYVYFIDAAAMQANGDQGNVSFQIQCHMARANSVAAAPFFTGQSSPTIFDGLNFFPSSPLVGPQTTRMPIFWDTQELATNQDIMFTLRAENNVNLTAYSYRVYGRYYDRQLLANRSFGRLVAPPPVAPGE